ncbi:MAG: tail fiber domain-containing protein [Scytonematopsis contorta HA4267-MV1]|jgi:hypothetical protein|nr:tail fiber domain-containing protein [Scytonematopsis contorta HA4267-MV1]
MTQKDVDMRPNYFPGQYLLEDDFQLEQEYHSDRQRRHHRLFISPGIAEGLVVTKLDGLRINITSGTAIDKQGRQIILSNEKSGAIELNQISSSNLSNGEYTLSIQYDEKQTLLQEGTIVGNRRWEESPKFTLKTQADESDSIPLAKLKIEGDTVSIINDEKIRKYAGVRLPSSDPTQAPIIGFQGATINVEGNQYIKGNLTVAETIYAGGNPIAYENYEIYLKGTASDSPGGNDTFLKIANVDMGMNSIRGLNTVILHPNGTFKKKENHNIWNNPNLTWDNWADWIDKNADTGDIVAVGSWDAISDVPKSGSGETLLQKINAKKVLSGLGNVPRTPYALLFIKGQSSCIEVLQPYLGNAAEIKTTYYQLLTLQYTTEQQPWQTPIFDGLTVKSNQPNSSIELLTNGTNGVEIANREGRLAISTQNVGDALNILDGGNVGIGTTSPTEKLEVNSGNLKVSGNITAANASFTNNLTVAGTIYAGGNPIAYENYEIYLRGTATDSPDGNNTFLKIANVVMGMDPIRGLNTVILNPNGTFKKKAHHDVWSDILLWNTWANWINENAAIGDIVAVGSFDAVSNPPKDDSAEKLLQKINAKTTLSVIQDARHPYALLFIQGQSSCIEVSQPYKGNAAQIKTTYYQLLTLQYTTEQQPCQTPIFGGLTVNSNQPNSSVKLLTSGTNGVEIANRGGRLALSTKNGGDALNILDGGNVGIGTASPTEKLEVKGNLKASGGATFNGNVSIGTLATLEIINQSQDVEGGNTLVLGPKKLILGYHRDYSWIQSYDSRPLAINPLGNKVGIGTNKPDEMLDVKGNLKASGKITGADGIFTGKVGIGTTEPQASLDVRGAIHAGNSDIYFTDTEHVHTGLSNKEGYAAIENDSKNFNALMILGRKTAEGRKVKLWDDLTVNGKVGIGTDASKNDYVLNIKGNVYVDGTIYSTCRYVQKHSTKKDPVEWSILKSDGSWWEKLENSPASDFNLKKDIVPITNALTTLEKLKPVSFHWSDLNYFLKDIDAEFPDSVDRSEEEIEAVNKIKAKAKTHLEKQQFGFIAQDIEQVLPDWVTTGDDSYKRINMSQLNSLLVQSIKELKIAHDSSIAENNALKQRIERLEQKVESLLPRK